jgi:hypothetical protein
VWPNKSRRQSDVGIYDHQQSSSQLRADRPSHGRGTRVRLRQSPPRAAASWSRRWRRPLTVAGRSSTCGGIGQWSLRSSGNALRVLRAFPIVLLLSFSLRGCEKLSLIAEQTATFAPACGPLEKTCGVQWLRIPNPKSRPKSRHSTIAPHREPGIEALQILPTGRSAQEGNSGALLRTANVRSRSPSTLRRC